MVQEDLGERGSITDDDGFVYQLDELTPADRQAVVLAVQEQLFRRLNGRASVEQTKAAVTATAARAIKPADSNVKSATVYLMGAFGTWKANAGARTKSEFEFKSACEDFISVNGDLPLVEITEEHFVTYKKHLNESKSKKTGKPLAQMTKNKRMGGVKAVIQAAIDNGDLKVHPGANVVVAKGAKSKLRVDGLFDDEIKLLFDSPVRKRRLWPDRR